MCGRFALSPKTDQVEHLLPGVKNVGMIKPRYNIAPTQDVTAVLNDGNYEVSQVRWGLIPSWSKDESIGNKLINARGETVHEKPSFKTPFKKKRCLILASGFYEWKKEAGLTKKVPHFIKLKSDEVFAFAGLWDSWISHDGEKINSATIITTSANELVKPIHDRMPVILSRESCLTWLDNSQSQDNLSKLLAPYPSELMYFYSVSNLVNNPAFDSPECILPITN